VAAAQHACSGFGHGHLTGLGDAVVVEARGELPLKGKREPVKVYAVSVESLVAESA
jgi:class 3 adenylate cyclase